MNFAHIKWFVDSKNVVEPMQSGLAGYSLISFPVIFWGLILLSVVGIALWGPKLLPSPSKAYIKKATSLTPTLNKIFKALIGIYLVVVAIFWSEVLSPEIPAGTNAFTTILWVLQIVAGVLLIFDVMPLIAAWATTVLLFGAVLIEGPAFLLEYGLLAGAMFYILTASSAPKSYFGKLRPWAIPVLRVTTGISLITFAFTEKLLHPELSIAFLNQYHWNFMHALGFTWFSNQFFVLTAGFVETIFGVLFILGKATRATTLAIGALFATSVVTMLISVGKWEVEDLPVYAIAIILIAFGSGTKLVADVRSKNAKA
jgi:uncharacterized membrane protein YphA (DoxX/SURF4 family)